MTKRIIPFFGEYVAKTSTPRSAMILLAIRKSNAEQEMIPTQARVNRSMVRTIGAVSKLMLPNRRVPNGMLGGVRGRLRNEPPTRFPDR